MNRFKLLLSYRKVIENLTLRNIKIKYKNTWLGFLWVFLQPLFTISVLYFVFSNIIKIDIDKFPLFLAVGILPWTFHANALNEGASSIVGGSNLLLKVNMPMEILPLTYCLSNLIDFVFSLLVLIAILMFFHIKISLLSLFFLSFIIVLQLLFLSGLTMFLSVWQVFFNDVAHFLSVILMFWFYLTPIFYDLKQVPLNLHKFYIINPMLYFIEAYRRILFFGNMLNISLFLKLLIISCSSFLGGWLTVVAKEKYIIKEL